MNPGPAGRHLSIRVGGSILGIPAADVVEVTRPSRVTPVPLAHPAIRGLVNWRGDIVTVIDPGVRLGLAGDARAGDRLHVIVRNGGGIVCLPVDDLEDVADHPDGGLRVLDLDRMLDFSGNDPESMRRNEPDAGGVP